jgi:hypothetical protein
LPVAKFKVPEASLEESPVCRPIAPDEALVLDSVYTVMVPEDEELLLPEDNTTLPPAVVLLRPPERFKAPAFDSLSPTESSTEPALRAAPEERERDPENEEDALPEDKDTPPDDPWPTALAVLKSIIPLDPDAEEPEPRRTLPPVAAEEAEPAERVKSLPTPSVESPTDRFMLPEITPEPVENFIAPLLLAVEEPVATMMSPLTPLSEDGELMRTPPEDAAVLAPAVRVKSPPTDASDAPADNCNPAPLLEDFPAAMETSPADADDDAPLAI